jgi:hypothetical protein
MKRPVVFAVFFLILGFALAGLYWSQRRSKSTPVSANAILNMAADAQRDLSRIPMHFTRLSDEQEIAIGKELATRYAAQTRKLTPEEEGLEKYVIRVGNTVALRPSTFAVHLHRFARTQHDQRLLSSRRTGLHRRGHARPDDERR